MPYALSEGAGDRRGGWVAIESQGLAHRIVYDIDPVRRTANPDYQRASSDVRNGSRITVHFPPIACHLLVDSSDQIFRMVQAFWLFNPNLAITFRGWEWEEGSAEEFSAYDLEWPKWTGKDKTSPHWYDLERFERLIGAVIGDDRDNGRKRSVRDFVGTFRGLAGSRQMTDVMTLAELPPMPLPQLFADGQVARDAVARLLRAMRNCSPPVNPKLLGAIGDDPLRATLKAYEGAIPNSFRYRCVPGIHDDSIPFAVEAAFISFETRRPLWIHSAVNWSPMIDRSPFRFGSRRLSDLLESRSIFPSSPVCVVLHLISPRPQFTDRGKSALAVSGAVERAFTEALQYVTANWARSEAAQERAEDREREAAWRRQRQALTKPKRPKNEIVGTGLLYQELKAASDTSGFSVNELTVLSPKNDAFRFDTRVGHANAKWFTDHVERLLGETAQVHLRGLFYRIVVLGDVLRPDGQPFTNTYKNWAWLTNQAAKAARYLTYVPFERIKDERNAAPLLFLPDQPPGDGLGGFVAGKHIEPVPLDPLLPHLEMVAPRGKQPYRIILIGEKSSLQEVLRPIAEQVHGELLLPTGESTDTMVHNAAARAVADGRPAVILYFVDFDPSGHQMAISVSRKLQALRTLFFPGLDIRLHRVALTRAQVEGLPSTPLSPKEKRSDRWEAAMGRAQTEIDALLALRPGDLREIALDAIRPFFDFTLEDRCREASESWLRDAEARIKDHPAHAAAKKKIAAAYAKFEKARVNALRTRDAEYARIKDQVGIDDTDIPAPEAKITARAPTPLFTTDDDFVTASRKLISEKRYEFEDEEEDEIDDC